MYFTLKTGKTELNGSIAYIKILKSNSWNSSRKSALQTGNRNISSPYDQTQKDCGTITSISFLISELYLHGIHLMPNHVSASSLWRPEREV